MVNITDNIIARAIQELREQSPKYKKYERYYRGEHDILQNYAMQDSRSNMRVVFNYPRKFVDATVGYLLGQDINYTHKGRVEKGEKSASQVIENELGYWIQAHDIELMTQTEIFGEAYEVNYINSEGEFKATVKNPTNMKVITDGTVENNVLLAVSIYTKPLEDGEFADVFIPSQRSIKQYSIGENDELTFMGQVNQPIDNPVIVSIANREKLSGFHDIISLVDAYNNINSDLVNEIADHRSAYLTVAGAKITPEDGKRMKASGILSFKENVNMDWLTKDINDKFIQNELTLLEDKMYDLSDHVNFNDTSLGSNTSSLALKNKLINLDNRVSLKEAQLEIVISKRLKNFFEYIKINKDEEYDYRDVSIEFTKNVPTDIVATAEIVDKLQDLVSHETLLAQLPFIKNPEMELEKKQQEREENLKGNILLEEIFQNAQLPQEEVEVDIYE